MPAKERFYAGALAARNAYFRLVVEHEFIAFQAATECVLKLELLQRSRVHGGGVEAIGVPARCLGSRGYRVLGPGEEPIDDAIESDPGAPR
jgi:hypothetical protein